VNAVILAAWLQEDHGLILGGYGIVAAGLGAYVWSMVRRGRDLARQLPDEDKPWT
jgi:hypothetical protein